MSWILWSIIVLISIPVVYIWYKSFMYWLRNFFYLQKTKDIKFLLVKIPRRDWDVDQKNDIVQSMKQNLEIMNQIYKNVYSIRWGSYVDKHFAQNYISAEIYIEKESIKFIFAMPSDFLESFEKTISSFSPWSVVEEIQQPKLLDAWKFAQWWYFILSKDNAFPIKTYENFEADPMDSILSAFSRVTWEEKLCLQILASPLSESWQKKLRKEIEKIKSWSKKWLFSFILWAIWSVFDGWGDKKDKWWEQNKNWYSSQQIQDVEKKAEDEWFDIVIRALAISSDPTRPDKIINDLARSMNQYNYIWLNSFAYLQTDNLDEFIKHFILRFFTRPFFTLKKYIFFIKSQVLNIKELSSIFHFPHSRFNKNPRIRWQKFKIVPAPDDLPKEWILLGHNLYGWVKKEIRLNPSDRFRHFYIVWQTGTWKSTIILSQAQQDLKLWSGFCMIDPHGDLCEDLLKYYPKERIDDLIYFNASDFEMPLWFNVFEAETDEERDIVVNDLVDMFVQIYWPEIFGPRIQDYFRNGCLTLMDQPEWGTLVEIVRLFVDEAYQKLKIKNVKSPVIRMWWEKTFASMWQKEKAEMIPFFQSKFWPYTTTPIIRNILWQPKSSFDMYAAMQEWKVILLNLSKWQMWELNSKLLWSMMVVQLKLAALRRARLPENERKEYFVYIDEFQNYITPSIETILSEARKYRLWLIMAHQYISQLVKKSLWWETDLRPAVFGNVWNIMSYRISNEDAEHMAKEMAPDFGPSDFQNFDKFKWAIRMSVAMQPTKPFSISVKLPWEEPTINPPEKIKIIKEIARLKWWRKKDLVEKEIYYRIWA